MARRQKMINYILTLAIIITFQGCTPSKLNQVSYLYQSCEGKGNVGIRLDKDGVYRCIDSKHQVKKTYRKKKIESSKIYKKKTVSSGCETTITEIFTSKALGSKPLTVCKGKILTGNQKTKTIHVSK